MHADRVRSIITAQRRESRSRLPQSLQSGLGPVFRLLRLAALRIGLASLAGVLFGVGLGVYTSAAAQDTAQSARPSKQPLYQYGAGVIAYWSVEDHLIDAMKQNGYDTVYADIGRGQKFELTDLIEAGHFDPATQSFRSLPFGKRIFLGFIRGGAKTYPAQYAGKWVIDWEGDGEVNLAYGMPRTSKRVGDNRIEVEFAPDQKKWTGVFLKWVGKGGVRNIRAYRAEEEAALNAGRVFSKTFIDLVSSYPIVRTMDIARVNSSGIRTLDQMANADTLFWAGAPSKYYGPGVKRGFPLFGQVRLATAADNRLWITVPPMLGLPDVFDTPTYFNDVRIKNAQGQTKEVFKDRVAEAARETVDADDVGVFAEALVQALIDENYPPTRMLYVEMGNEIWNFSGAFLKSTLFHEGLGQGLDLKSGRKAYGYRAAQFADTFEKALAANGRRQEWTMVVGAHTANPYSTRAALQGVQAYYKEHEIALSSKAMRRFGVATTNYYSGGFHFDSQGNMYGARDAAGWRKAWLAELENDPAALADRIENWIVDGPPVRATRAWMMRQHKEHSTIAHDFGARYIGNYEGGSHDDLDRDLAKNPAAVAFYRRFMAGPGAARILAAVNDSFLAAYPGAILSDYRRIGMRTGAHAPWDEQIYGEQNAVIDTLERYLGGDPDAIRPTDR